MLNENKLLRMLNEDELRDSVLLVFSGKKDLPTGMSAAEMTYKLVLHGLCHHQWFFQVYRATMGDQKRQLAIKLWRSMALLSCPLRLKMWALCKC